MFGFKKRPKFAQGGLVKGPAPVVLDRVGQGTDGVCIYIVTNESASSAMQKALREWEWRAQR